MNRHAPNDSTLTDPELEDIVNVMSRCKDKDCNLCKRRAKCAGVFVAEEGGTFLCSSCIPLVLDLESETRPDGEVNEGLGDPNIEVWENGSGGWLIEPECRLCGDAIPVELDAPEDES